MRLQRTILAVLPTVLLVLPAGCASDDPVGPGPDTTIEGRVVAAETEAPVTGATVTADPGDHRGVTGTDGRFAVDVGAAGGTVYTVTAEKVGYGSLWIFASTTAPSTLHLELPWLGRAEVPEHGFRVRATLASGGLEAPTITWRVEAENGEAESIGPITLEGSLDRDVPGGLDADVFDLGAEGGEIDLEIGKDGRSYTVRFDALAAGVTLRVFDLTVPSTGAGTICHFLEGEAENPGPAFEYSDSSCLARPVDG